MLDCVCCLSILLHVESTLYYWNPLFVNLGSGGAEQLDGLLVAANIICVLHMFGLFFLTLIEHRFRHSRSLRQTMTWHDVALTCMPRILTSHTSDGELCFVAGSCRSTSCLRVSEALSLSSKTRYVKIAARLSSSSSPCPKIPARHQQSPTRRS